MCEISVAKGCERVYIRKIKPKRKTKKKKEDGRGCPFSVTATRRSIVHFHKKDDQQMHRENTFPDIKKEAEIKRTRGQAAPCKGVSPRVLSLNQLPLAGPDSIKTCHGASV